MRGSDRSLTVRRLSTVLAAALIVAAGTTALVIPRAAEANTGVSVTIVRDEHGVPHVYSSTVQGLMEGAGYATAQDRLWQADILRRVATGTLSELLGPGAGNSNIAQDEFFRLFTGGTKHRAALYKVVPAADKMIINSFRDGMNRWIKKAEASGQLPLEYQGLGIQPRAWTTDDIVATAMLSIFEFGANGMDEVNNATQLQAMIARDGADFPKVFADAHWVDDSSSPTTIPDPPSSAARQSSARQAVASLALPSKARVAALASASSSAEQLIAAMRSTLERYGVSGIGHSNSVAISGALTTDGMPLLAGGPQTGYTVPQSFMEIGLHGAGFDVTGVTLAGNPGVQIGTTPTYAWTVTSGGDDNEDFYAEVLDTSGHPGQYFYKNTWHNFVCRLEVINVAGGSPVNLTACNTVHGPILGISGDTGISLRDVTREDLAGSVDGFFNLSHATDWNSFLAAGREIIGSLNLTYADTSGNIGYAHVGRVPIRVAGENVFLPHQGTGGDEWQGYVDPTTMPAATNPTQGWFANWNNKPAAGWANGSAGFWDWGPVQRVQVIMAQLAALAPGSADLSTLVNILKTTGAITETPVGIEPFVFVQALLPEMLANLDTSQDSRLPAVQTLLSSWNELRVDANNDGNYDSPAVTVFNAWLLGFFNSVFVPFTGPINGTGSVDLNTLSNEAMRLFQGSSAALPLNENYLGSTSLTDATTQSLIGALDALTSQYGTSDMTQWLTPDAFIHYSPLGARSVPNIPWMNRGTYNQFLHVGATITGENVVAPGQSGDDRSGFFADQLQNYATWAFKPMRLTPQDLIGYTTSTTVFYV